MTISWNDVWLAPLLLGLTGIGLIVFLLYRILSEIQYQSFLMGDDEEEDDGEGWKRG